MRAKLICLYCLMLLSNKAIATDGSDQGWKLIRDENDIRVYMQEVPGSDIVKAMAVTRIHASASVINDILEDVDMRKEWVPYLLNTTILKKQSTSERIEYAHFHAPWPAYDRDFVYLHKKIINQPEQVIYEAISTSIESMPEQDDKVRGEIFYSRYKLDRIDDYTTRVELVYYADPKGWLPDWIINIIQKALPYKILLNLKTRFE